MCAVWWLARENFPIEVAIICLFEPSFFTQTNWSHLWGSNHPIHLTESKLVTGQVIFTRLSLGCAFHLHGVLHNSVNNQMGNFYDFPDVSVKEKSHSRKYLRHSKFPLPAQIVLQYVDFVQFFCMFQPILWASDHSVNPFYEKIYFTKKKCSWFKSDALNVK